MLQLGKYIIILLLFLPGFAYAQNAPPLHYEITGVKGAAHENVAKRLKILAQKIESPATEVTLKKFYYRAPAQISKALQPFGYFRADVHSTLDKKTYPWLARFAIDPGPPLKVEKLIIHITGAGKDNLQLKALLHEVPLQQGKPLVMEDYNNAKQMLFNLAQINGYLQAKFVRHEIQIDLKKYRAAVLLEFSTGPQYYFGRVIFSDNPLHPEFLQRFVHFAPGQPYSTADILKLQDDLSSSGYFKEIKIDPKIKHATDNHVPIKVNLTPRKPKTFTYGLGYGTDTGVRGLLGVNWHWLNAWGHRLQAEFRPAQIESTAAATYTIPGRNPVTDRYYLSGSTKYINLSHSQAVSGQFSAAYESKRGEWQRTLALNAIIERQFDRTDEKTDASEPALNTSAIYPSANFNKLHTDNLLNPSQGYRLTFTSQAGLNKLGSKTDFLQGVAEGRYLYRINDHSRMLFHGSQGLTAVKDISDLPIDLQLLTGGARTVRGYRYKDIGPGRYLTVAGLEYQHQVYKQWSSALFFDAGDAYNRFDKIRIRRGIGLGIVRTSPIGSINIGLAHGLDQKGRKIQFVFSIGPDL